MFVDWFFPLPKIVLVLRSRLITNQADQNNIKFTESYDIGHCLIGMLGIQKLDACVPMIRVFVGRIVYIQIRVTDTPPTPLKSTPTKLLSHHICLNSK